MQNRAAIGAHFEYESAGNAHCKLGALSMGFVLSRDKRR